MLVPEAARCQRRYEAQRLPDVVTSGIDPRAYDSRRTAYAPAAEAVPRAPDFARPSRQWLREFLTDFQAVREHLARQATCSGLTPCMTQSHATGPNACCNPL